MRHAARRTSLLTLLSAALLAGIWASAAHAAGLGLEEWEAGTCNGSEAEVAVKANCSYASEHSKFYTQAAGHPPWGLTGFKLKETAPGSGDPAGQPLKRIRVDVPAGLAANPQALNTCPKATFESSPKSCPADSKAGFVELKAYVELPALPQMLPLKGNVYNLPQETNHPLLFGIDVEGVPPLVEDTLLLLEGHVSYAHEAVETSELKTADFHEWFEINNIPPKVKVKVGLFEDEVGLKTLESKLFFNGHAGKEGKENFLTMPSSCSAPTTSFLELETYGPTEKLTGVPTTPPVGVSGCDGVPFAPTATVTSETSQYDTPDGVETVVRAPQNEGAKETNTSDIADAHVTLPEGLTLNPSAARGLEACTPSQLGKGTTNEVGCPLASKIGTVNIETDLPPGSLAGNVYLGKANGTGTISGPPYYVFIDAESIYGVSVRLEGTAVPNPVTGRLEVSFLGNPQLPFSDLTLKLNGGPRAPLANPLTCGNTLTEAMFSPYTTGILRALEPRPYITTGCPSSIPFTLTQSATPANATAGAYSTYSFNLARADGQQYLSQVSTTLPAGLLGAIPSVTLCNEPQAAAGTCTAASQIGVASVTAGAGPEPVSFSGPVYLTGPYDGAPYGLSIPVPVVVAPSFNLGTVTTRATIKVNPTTARVTVATTNLPTIVAGVPVRLKTLHVEVNRPSFIFNPTNCSALATESTLTSTFNATQSLATGFQVGNCSALPFKPVFKVSTSAKTSKKNGASLQVSLTQPAHEANIKSVFVSLPTQLPSRLTTLQKACPEGTFAANPVNCRKLGSEVGSAVVTTPVLPGQLKGSAYLVSHGGEAFPDLDIVLEGDGITVILTGNTKITKGITSSTFAAIPDVPVSSFVLTLPTQGNSALTSNGSLCAKALTVPTTIDAQSGAQFTQKTKLAVSSCPVQILSHKVVGHTLVVRVKTFAAGSVSLKGKNLKTPRYKQLAKAKIATFTVPLSRRGLAALARHRKLKISVRVGFVPKTKTESVSSATIAVKFK